MPLPPPETVESDLRHMTAGGYGRQDTVRLNPTRLTLPIPETVLVAIDERSEAMAAHLVDIHNLAIVRTRLPVGDICAEHGDKALLFVITDAIELSEAMDDGRLARIVRDISHIAHPACMVVEGGLYHARLQPLARLAALQTRLMFGMRIPVLETLDRRHTAYAIATAIRDHFFGPGGKFDPAPRRLPWATAHESARLMLETIPGVSPTRAEALLRRFGSVAGVASARVSEIATTDGIGTKTAERLHAVLHAGAANQN